MPRSSAQFGRSLLIVSCLGTLFASGCVTVSMPQMFGKNQQNNKVQRLNFQEEIPETPKDPKKPAELKLAYARWMEDINHLGEARKQYHAVHEMEPKNVHAILGLARMDQIAGQHEQAEQRYKKAIKLDPGSADAQYGLGQFYASQERWSEAVEPLSTAMRAEPDNSKYRYQLAIAMAHSGDVESALPHFIRTIGDAEGHYNVGVILYGMGRVEQAEKHLRLALSKKPQFPQAEEWLVRIQDGGQAGPKLAHSDSNPQVNQVSATAPVASKATAQHAAARTHSQPTSASSAPAIDHAPPAMANGALSQRQLEQLQNQQPYAPR